MTNFRRLLVIALVTGALSGGLLFVLQRLTLVPLIQKAEVFEDAAEHAHAHEEEHEWKPANGLQRNSLTALGTVLTGVGFAALLFGFVSLTGHSIDAKRGLFWGIGGFLCVTLAPALGLPPQPPGAPVADLTSRQLWWVATVVATGLGLLLIWVRNANWWKRIAGILLIALPHLIGAPLANGKSIVPADLVHQFCLYSILCMAAFWLVLGTLGGYLTQRLETKI